MKKIAFAYRCSHKFRSQYKSLDSQMLNKLTLDSEQNQLSVKANTE